jgi:hypothetical protein
VGRTILEYLEGALNASQLEAATTTEGPLLVLAGPGSGKTRTLVHRIAYLVHTGRARPWEVFAVTFTNKAAAEMRDRLGRLIGPGARDAWIGTFHALAARMLRIEGHRIGVTERFTICDEDDSFRLVKRAMDELAAEVGRWTVSPREVAEEIDRAKNRGLDVPAYLAATEADAADPLVRTTRAVYPVYQRALAAGNAPQDAQERPQPPKRRHGAPVLLLPLREGRCRCCEQPPTGKCRGLCLGCYKRARRHGVLERVANPRRDSARFAACGGRSVEMYPWIEEVNHAR